LYARCRTQLSPVARAFWDARPDAVSAGIGTAGKFEGYFRLFRKWVLPLVHRRSTVRSLLEHRSAGDRRQFYDEIWDTAGWRILFRAFFSERVLGRLGRDPSFFRYAEGSVAEHLLARVRHALAELDPSENPYLAWILTGTHADILPHALRAENFDAIRNHLDRLEWHCLPIEELSAGMLGAPLDRANLSNIFEYVSADHARALLTKLAQLSRDGSRLAYWNMMVPRRGAELLPDRLRPLSALSHELFQRDKAFFYRDFVVEEVIC
jgi:S-adenosylmethionine-diacylglycerol 3-amino-3-carboxypropyl transferase